MRISHEPCVRFLRSEISACIPKPDRLVDGGVYALILCGMDGVVWDPSGSSRLSELPEAGAHFLDEQFRLFESGEMPAAFKPVPVNDILEFPLRPPARRYE